MPRVRSASNRKPATRARRVSEQAMRIEREALPRGWRLNALLTGGVVLTVVMALLLAQLDILQVRAALDRPGLPIVNIQATAIAEGQVIRLNLDSEIAAGEVVAAEPAGPVPDDLNPRPPFITGVGEGGVIFTVCGEVPEGWLLYSVKPGETLAALAAATEATVAELSAANCLAEGDVTAGMQVLLPREPAATLCGPPQWWARYQIRAGDTLGALAINRGTTIDEILRANCREALDLLAGQFIFLPPGNQPGAAAPIPQPSLTPLPTETPVPTLAPLPTATNNPPPPPPPPTDAPPTIPPTEPPTEPPPTDVPPTDVPPTATPPPLPTDAPPTATLPPPPTEPPPATEPPPPTEPPATEPPPPTDEPPDEEG